ncbi:uncharacterized protein LOC141631917 [Silene latifolia]|uniref:uncharacterized protein LOC141631917 n=1 Tax=Silene latifolia TaxID=37657 RepID=UPI003D77823B
MMKTLAMNQVAMQKESQALLNNTKEFQTAMLQQNRLIDSRFVNLETQVGQILNTLNSQPTQGGSLPSHTIPPPTKEQAKVISLRNGRELVEAPKAPKKTRPLPIVHEVEDVVEDEIEVVVEHGEASTPQQIRVNEPFPEYEPQAPFPSALNDTRIIDKKTSNLYDIFRKVEVNIPLLDLLSSVPKHAKFLKELCTTKRSNKAKSMKKVRASEHVSAIFQKRLPQKCSDPGMFTIPCKIGDLDCQHAMLDLGASINVLPNYLYESLKLGPLKPTRTVISLADRSNIYPKGIVEDVLVKVGEMLFPADFYVIEMEPEKGSTPILLGRPFMRTSNTKIDVSSGRLTMEFEGEKIEYSIHEAMKYPTKTSSLCFLEIFEPIVQTVYELCKVDALDVVLTNGLVGEDVGYALSCNLQETIKDLEENPPMEEWEEKEEIWKTTGNSHRASFPVPELAPCENPPVQDFFFLYSKWLEELPKEKPVPSIVKPPIVKLKPLPSHLKYAFLGDGETLPVIISSKLTKEREEALIRVLKQHKETIGWTMADIKGISPTLCMHRILLEDEAKPVRQPQRRLNPPMMDVVKKEVLKLFHVGMIYPISDSQWVSPTQVVPKKSGLTVVENHEDHVENFIEVFMDDFTVHQSFEDCLSHLTWVLQRCIDTNLVLNHEKCHFMVDEGIVLGHVISSRGIEVDKAKVDTIRTLPYPTNVREMRSFLGHTGFYRRFIKDFSKIATPLCNLLQKDCEFIMSEEFKGAFDMLKEKLISAPIIQPPNWNEPQRVGRAPHVIQYASTMMNEAQRNYTTTEKEFLAVVFALEKFRPYILGAKVIIFTDHAALRHLVNKKESKPRLMRWVLLLSEFDVELKDKKGTTNTVADHLSRIVQEKSQEVLESPIQASFPDDTLLALSSIEPWYAHIVNVLVLQEFRKGISRSQRDKIKSDAKYYVWDDPYLWKFCADQVIRRCVPNTEIIAILKFCHEYACGGHFGAKKTARKVLESGFFWPTLFRDAHAMVKTCDRCQRVGNISKRG